MAKLVNNVFVDGAWYGPDYPDAGNPPKDAVTNPAAFGKATEADVREGRAKKVGEKLVDSDDDADEPDAGSGGSSGGGSSSGGSSSGQSGGGQRSSSTAQRSDRR